MRRIGFCLLLSLVLVGIMCGSSRAIVLDFYDNVAAPPGFYGLAYYNFYDAPKLKDDSGRTVKTATGDDISMTMNVVSLRPVVYLKGLDTLWAFNAVIPFGKMEQRNLSTGATETSSGLGDILIGPAVFLFQHEKTGTFLSFWEFVSVPTGDYSRIRAIEGGPNLGYKYWYLQHQLAFATSFVEKSKWSYDMNVSYFQKFNTTDLKPGDSMEFEGILGYGITDAFRVGAYARYWFDLKGSTSYDVDSDKVKIFSAGPSIAYAKEKWGLNLRYVYDFDVKNSVQGSQVWLRFNYSF